MYSERTYNKSKKIKDYCKEGHLKTISVKEFNNEEQLVEYQKTRDVEIKNRIIIQNIPLAINIAMKCWCPKEMRRNELIAVGLLALCESIDSYNPTSATLFSTYAATLMHHGIIDYTAYWYGENHRKVGLLIKKYIMLINRIYGHNANLKDKEIMDYVIGIMIEEEHITDNMMKELKSRILSERINYENIDEVESVPYDEEDDFDVTEFMRENHERLFAKLNDAEKFIIEYRYGYIDGKMHKLEDLAKILGISNQAVQQKEKRALIKMRQIANVCLKKVRQ